MNPSKNPYTPGAGNPPPELAGRDWLLERVRVGLRRMKAGRHAKSLLMVGLRGVGKTVLLNRLAQDAAREKFVCLHIEAQEDRPLSAMLIPELHKSLLRIGRAEAVKKAARHALNIIAGVARSLQIEYQGMSIGLDKDFQPLAPATGNLESDLSDVFQAVGDAIKKKNTAFILLVDELQYAKKEQLAALIVALHKCQQWQLPVMLVGAGLPQLVGNAGNAKSYAERMFDFPEIGKLDRAAALQAIEARRSASGSHFSARPSPEFSNKPKAIRTFCRSGVITPGKSRRNRRLPRKTSRLRRDSRCRNSTKTSFAFATTGAPTGNKNTWRRWRG